jgi:hypothetical protein
MTPKSTLSTDMSIPPAIVDLLALQAELCSAGVVLCGYLVDGGLVMFEDRDAEMRRMAEWN